MTAVPPASMPGDARGWIPELQRVGYSANGALRFLQSQGAGMNRQTFLRAWGEVGRDLASRGAMAAHPIDTPLDPQSMSTWRAGRPNTYGFQVNVALRDRATGLVTTKVHYVFSPENLTPAAVVDSAIADYVEAQTAGGPSGVVVAATFVSGHRMLGRSAA